MSIFALLRDRRSMLRTRKSSSFMALMLGLTLAPCMAHAATAPVDFLSSGASATYGGTVGGTQSTVFTTTAGASTFTDFNGLVGIGIGTTTTPAGLLQINGADGLNGTPVLLAITNTSLPKSYFFIDSGANGNAYRLLSSGATARNLEIQSGTTSDQLVLNTNGNVGIQTATPTYTLTVGGAGTVMATAYYHSSDARLKMDIHPVNNALDRLLAIKGVEFNWKKDGRADMGVVAQNVAEVFPNVVHKDDNGMMSVEYDSLVGPMIEGMRQLKTENDGLKAEIKEIRAEIKTLQQNNAATHAASATIEAPTSASVIEQ